MPGSADRSTVKTTETTITIMEALVELQGGRVDELADHLDIAPSTVHRHLKTLENTGYAVKQGDEYHISYRFLTIGCKKRKGNPAYTMARDKVDQLIAETGERAQFIVEEEGRRVYLYFNTNQNAVQTDGIVGNQGLLHCSAAGKAILAALPESRVTTIIDRHGLPARTTHTITDRDKLFDELEEIRDQGVAYNDEESAKGLRAVGSTIQEPSGNVLGALSISGPANRLKGDWYEQELSDLILGTTNEIELNIKYKDSI